MNVIERLHAMFHRPPQKHELDDQVRHLSASSSAVVQRAEREIRASQSRRQPRLSASLDAVDRQAQARIERMARGYEASDDKRGHPA